MTGGAREQCELPHGQEVHRLHSERERHSGAGQKGRGLAAGAQECGDGWQAARAQELLPGVWGADGEAAAAADRDREEPFGEELEPPDQGHSELERR